MTAEDIKRKIKIALQSFSKGKLSDNALNLFDSLGYITERKAHLDKPDYKTFKEEYIDVSPAKFNETKALVKDWNYVDLLFQLSKEEVLKQTSLFDTNQVDKTRIESYLFFVIELSKNQYSRTELSLITREVNRLFPMPVMILFKHGNGLTLSVINRRLHKRDEGKDVLEKVTQIKDIQIENPHRAHIEILFDLSFDELRVKHNFLNFVELHNAWQKTLDTKELNKKFFNELANWYFWATQKVSFPDDAEEDKDLRNATGVIRLITRIMFVWFLKEKNLVPDDLFDEKKLKQLLKYSDQHKSTYYKAILQNLFFATLNTEMGNRKFRSAADKSQSSHYFIHNLFRYEKEFINPKATLEKYFDPIPFLNGGLFECLDKQLEDKGKLKSVRIDGFSDRDDNVLKVPDELFFSEKEKIIDLSDIYGTPKKSKEKVRGLIDILSSYKFTITENTPIEEEVALDPELLGKVFENLLANYNPETQTTARKQTGSFYTPREIVNYMVDESLLASLKQHLGDSEDAVSNLRNLLSYSQNEVPFSIKEKEKLITAIDSIKILDPACGSGAFPMGILHKLVHILHKLDPKNELWKQRQIEKASAIDDAPSREAAIETIKEAFENNELDYGRKLYLIENCIYGVDIQPIAVQISKLRFFISLVVEQKTNPKKENLGIRPLPNLETKFVAANTLVALEKDHANLFTNPAIEKKKEQLRKIRHDYFEARTPKRKENCRIKDKQFRDELAALLVNNHDLQPATAKKVVAWNPYDQNASASFFDMEWMFGLKDGFDVVIANPPYVGEKGNKHIFEPIKSSQLGVDFYIGKMDIFYFFYHLALNIGKSGSAICFITTNYFTTAKGAVKLRRDLRERSKILRMVNLNEYKIFESAVGQHNLISLIMKDSLIGSKTQIASTQREGMFVADVLIDILNGRDNQTVYSDVPSDKLFEGVENYIRITESSPQSGGGILGKIKSNSILLGDHFDVTTGIMGGCDNVNKKNISYCSNAVISRNEIEIGDGVFVLDVNNPKDLAVIKSIRKSGFLFDFFKNSDIERYTTNEVCSKHVIFSSQKNNAYKNTDIHNHLKKFEPILKRIREINNESTDHFPYLRRGTAHQHIFSADKIVAPQRSSTNTFGFNDIAWYASADVYYITERDPNYSLKYLLGLLNSSTYFYWLYHRGKRKGNYLELYQKPLSEIPIKPLDKKQQLPFISLVDKIISWKKKNKDTSDLEKEIDEMVYQLYSFSGAEIKIIEGRK